MTATVEDVAREATAGDNKCTINFLETTDTQDMGIYHAFKRCMSTWEGAETS